MSTKEPHKRLYVRATPRARHALKKLLAEVGATEVPGEVTQEEFVTASWLWMAELGAEVVAEGIAPHVGTIRDFLSDSAREAKRAPVAGSSVADDREVRPRRKPRASG